MNIDMLAQLGQFLEKTQGALLGEDSFLRSTPFLWIVVPAFNFPIAKAFQVPLDFCTIGFSGVLFGLLVIKLYLEYRGGIASKSHIAKELLWTFTAPIGGGF